MPTETRSSTGLVQEEASAPPQWYCRCITRPGIMTAPQHLRHPSVNPWYGTAPTAPSIGVPFIIAYLVPFIIAYLVPLIIPPILYCQGHIDMVTEKNSSSSHNFMSDPIRLQRHGDWLKVDPPHFTALLTSSIQALQSQELSQNHGWQCCQPYKANLPARRQMAPPWGRTTAWALLPALQFWICQQRLRCLQWKRYLPW